jgi:hypothetical protein
MKDITDVMTEAFNLLQAKLAPGSLANTTANSDAFAAWFRSHGLIQQVPSMTAQQVADECYRAVRAQYFHNVFEFDKVPTRLKQELEFEYALRFEVKQTREHAKDANENSEQAFFERVKESEAKQKAKNGKLAQEIAAREIQSAILSYECYSGPNRVDHTRSEALRNELLRQAERRRKAGVDERQILREVREAIQQLP